MDYSGETLSVSSALNLFNGILSQTLPAVMIEGEVSSFNISKNKWVFFDLKEGDNSLPCFMSVYQLGAPIKDGQKIKVVAVPKITNWGKFSLTIQDIALIGEGQLKKAYEALKLKLSEEGLFDDTNKRSLPDILINIAVISSSSAAGWEDFKKIVNERWVGLNIDFHDVAVQGITSPSQIIKAIQYINQNSSKYEAIVILRGGGSLEDLSGFNDERLVRAISSSKTPVVVGVGHEVDETLSALAADINAATPTHAAMLISKDKQQFLQEINSMIVNNSSVIKDIISDINLSVEGLFSSSRYYFESVKSNIESASVLLKAYNPAHVLQRGYAIISSKDATIKKDSQINIETFNKLIDAKVINVKAKK